MRPSRPSRSRGGSLPRARGRARRLRGARPPDLSPDRPPDPGPGEPGPNDRRRRLHPGGSVDRHPTDEIGGLARSIEVLKQGAASMEEQRWVKCSRRSSPTRSRAPPRSPSSASASSPDWFRARRRRRRLLPRTRAIRSGCGASPSYGLAGIDGARGGDRAGRGPGRPVRTRPASRSPDRSARRLPSDLVGPRSGGADPGRRRGRWSRRTLCSRCSRLASFRALRPAEKALLEELLPVAAMSLAILERNLGTQELLLEQEPGSAKSSSAPCSKRRRTR